MAATQAFVTTFNERALIPTEYYSWDEYESRLLREAIAEAYYNAVIYKPVVPFAQRLKASNDLYKNIRTIQSPVYRLVEAYVAKVYGGSLDFEDLSTGSIPILMASDALKEALRQVWLWSNWRMNKGLYVRQGAMMGDSFIKIVDEPDRERVRMEVLHPGKVKSTEVDAVGNIKAVTIEYARQDEQRKWYTYTEMIDKERFATFRDGKPFAYVNDAAGNPAPEFPNLYGFVPLVHVKHKDVGMKWGANAFHAQMGKIDELNDASSLLNDNIRKHVNIIWYFFSKKSDVETNVSADQNTVALTADGRKHARDKAPSLYGPKDAPAPFPMVAQIDIAAAGVNIDRLLLELERDTPELALHRLREGGNLTAPGVRAGYSDAIDRFAEAQGNYDDGLIRAHKMAVSIGGFRGYDGFGAFNLDSFDKGDLEHFIKERPVVDDVLSKFERIQALQAAGASLQLIMQELDFDQETIDEEVTRKEEATRFAVRNFADSTFGADDDGDEEDGTEAETEGAEDTRAPVAA